MMSFSFAVFFVVAAVHFQASIAADTSACPPNSHFRQIKPCETRCDRLPTIPMPVDCPDFRPQWDCGCDEGFLAQSGTSSKNIVCVRPKECKVRCEVNMHYEPEATPCQPTCKNPQNPLMCKQQSGPRCVCNKGYIIDENQQYKCVKKCRSIANHKP